MFNKIKKFFSRIWDFCKDEVAPLATGVGGVLFSIIAPIASIVMIALAVKAIYVFVAVGLSAGLSVLLAVLGWAAVAIGSYSLAACCDATLEVL